jgi:2-oxoglutarate ferredoxin oxidoreductase subunit delta
MAYSVEINRKWCKKCGLCVSYCPKKVYDVDSLGAPMIARTGDCVGCLECEIRCPDFAIAVQKTA